MSASTGNVLGQIFMSTGVKILRMRPVGCLTVLPATSAEVFKDVDSIELGDDFVEAITTAVESCDVLLAVIGDQWLTITDQAGRRRLDNPETSCGLRSRRH